MAARYPLHHEQPVVVPQVMHPTCRFQDVSGVHIGTILHGLPSARHALCEPWDNGTRTEHGHSESPAPPKTLLATVAAITVLMLSAAASYAIPL